MSKVKKVDSGLSSLTDGKPNVRRSAYDVMLETLTNQVKTKKNKQDWDELKIRTEVSKDEYRKFISVENKCVGFCFNMRGNFLGMYNWKD